MRHSLILALAACEGEPEPSPEEPAVAEVEPGAIRGRVCDSEHPNGVSDAVAYTNLISEDGHLYDTVTAYTDLAGRFLLEDLPGEREYTIYVQLGDEILVVYSYYLEAGQTLESEEHGCVESSQ